MSNPFVDIIHQIQELDRRVQSMVRFGRVKEVNPQRAQVRFEDGAVQTSDWVDWQEPGSGRVRSWTAPKVGQEVVILSPSGELGQAIAMPGSYNRENRAPSSDPDEHVMAQTDDVRISMKGNAVTFKLGGTTIVMSADGVKITGGKIIHDNVNIGSNHTHKGVEPGSGNTGEPNA